MFSVADSDATWTDYAREPHKNKYVMGCAIFNSLIWAILFGVFTFKTDGVCGEAGLSDFTRLAFWLFLTCLILELVIITSILINYSTNPDSKFWAIFNCILLLADVGIGLFIYIRGIIVVVHSESETGCEALYYLLLVYVILVSVLLGLFALTLVVICCCAICCTFLNKP